MMGNIIKIILMILGAVLILWFLLPYFSNRILNIGNVTGIIVGLVLFLYGIFFHTVNFYIAWFWQKGVGKVVEIIIGLCILAIIILAITTTTAMVGGMKAGQKNYKTNGSMAATSEQDKDNIVIILGCKIRGDRPSLMLVERLEAGLEYLNEHPSSKVVVSGGQGEDEITAEADVMTAWLLEHGIDSGRIIKEDRSTDTHENLRYCLDIIADIDDIGRIEDGMSTTDRHFVIVTNEFHEYRALKIARSLNMPAESYPAKTAWWLFPTYYVREMYGILEDWFFAR